MAASAQCVYCREMIAGPRGFSFRRGQPSGGVQPAGSGSQELEGRTNIGGCDPGQVSGAPERDPSTGSFVVMFL